MYLVYVMPGPGHAYTMYIYMYEISRSLYIHVPCVCGGVRDHTYTTSCIIYMYWLTLCFGCFLSVQQINTNTSGTNCHSNFSVEQ